MEDEDDLIRRYILRELAEEEQQRVEERLMTDDAFFERLKIAEDELVDEYLGGELPRSERERFELSFLTTREGHQQVSFNTALRRYVSAARPVEPIERVQPRQGVLASLLAFLSAQRRLAAVAVAASVVLLAISSFLVIRLRHVQDQFDQLRASGQLNTQELQQQLADAQARNAQLDQELQKEKADRADLEQQIAKLSGGQEHPQKEQPPRPFFALILSPGTNRSGGPNLELKLQPGAASYPVKLLLEDDSFRSYTASLLAVDGAETAIPGSLKATGPRSARNVAVTLPAGLLRKGDYLLRLYGPQPQHERVATYQFRVVE
jgi:hypothetical protein